MRSSDTRFGRLQTNIKELITDQAGKLAPERAAPYGNLANFMLALQRLDEARETIREAQERKLVMTYFTMRYMAWPFWRQTPQQWRNSSVGLRTTQRWRTTVFLWTRIATHTQVIWVKHASKQAGLWILRYGLTAKSRVRSGGRTPHCARGCIREFRRSEAGSS